MRPEGEVPEFDEATESQILDAAARQRMLNQRFSKEVMARLLGEKVSYRETLRELRETATALERGGPVWLNDSRPVRVPAAMSKELAAMFRRQLELIAAMEAAAARIVGQRWKMFGRAVPGMTELSELCEEFQKVANRATVLVSQWLTTAWEERRAVDGRP